MLKALFLDVGGVLLTNGWDTNSRSLAATTFKLDPKEMDSRHRASFDTFEVGKMSLDDYLDKVVFYEKRDFTKEQFKEFMFAQSKAFPEMITLISDLKKKYSLKIAVISNEGRELTDFRIKKFNLDSFVDFFVSSCYVHLRKPDLDIFRLALDLGHLEPQEVIYVDDRLMFVQIAQKLGMEAIHHQDYSSTRDKLANYKLIV